ncbi:TonB-dependent receptor plug domain-containing protein, partial [Bordetella pertussis]|uniref:TonB-dependent receptor plug domain-containing protein n=1 Tax=Bordetella pertussis TaxID=520 RepID=UPI000B0D4B35
PAGPVAQLAPVTIEADGVRADPAWARTATRRNIRGLDENRVVTRIDGIRLPWLDDGARGIQGGLNAVDFNTLSRLDVVRGADSSAAGS